MTNKLKMTITFADKCYPYGFAKNEIAHQVARPYFEALSVGAFLALKQKPDLVVSKEKAKQLLTDAKFISSVSGRYQTHKAKTIKERIDYITNGLSANAD